MALDESPPQEEAQFNQAIAYLYRIDAILKHLNQASYLFKLDEQFRLTLVLYKELCQLMDKEEREDIDKIGKLAIDAYKLHKERIASGVQSLNVDIVDAFNTWEISLRDLIQKKGLGMPRNKDTRYALSGGGKR